MGNGDSSFVYINVSCSTYSAGEAVHGEIYIKIIEPIESSSLDLKVTGTEHVLFTQNVTSHTSTNEFLVIQETLHYWPSGFAEPGDYICPFKFNLPASVPASTFIDIPSIKASIRYKIKASLTRTLKYTSEFQVKTHLNSSNDQNNLKKTLPIKSCCCFNKGAADVMISTSKAEYTCDEVIKVNLNGLSLLMQDLRCKLLRVVMVTSDEACVIKKCEIMEFEPTADSFDIDLRALENRVGMQNSTMGKLVQCGYLVKIEGRMRSNCGSSAGDDLELSIRLNPKALQTNNPRYSMPWKPKYIMKSLDESYIDDETFSLIL